MINLTSILKKRVHQKPDELAYIFLADGEKKEETITYSQLWYRSSLIASYLKPQVKKQSKALLLYPQGLEFISAFLGCLTANIIAVPVYPPKNNHKMSRWQGIIEDCQPEFILTVSSFLDKIQSNLQKIIDLNHIKCVATDKLENISDTTPDNLTVDNEIALLQYTSGSTGNPKGVIISHDNILQNSAYIQTAFQLTEESVSVTWLPSFHDMGLIDGIIQPLYTGFLGVIMSPEAFLQKPIRWLDAISRYRATHSGGPNLGYGLCVEKITDEQMQDLDLSCWLSAYNGSEPIRYNTLERFINKFKSYGFKSHYFYPCYGMAESTLMVSGGKLEKEPICLNLDAENFAQNVIVETDSNSPKQLVGCGHSWLDTNIQIVNLETQAICEDNQIGEVWVSGSSIAQGYWQKQSLTEAVFKNKITSLNGDYLRTGDLGFIRDGELFITGRVKDLIIIWGKNYYPQDIETTVQNCHPALRQDSGAAFSVEVENQERLVIVQEVERTYIRNLDIDEVVKAIRDAVSIEYELQVYAIALIKPASIPKTSSGKIQRYVCRDKYLTQNLNLVGEWQQKLTHSESIKDINLEITEKNITHWLLIKLTGVLALEEDELDIESSFSEYGLDSSVALTLTGELAEWLNLELEPTLFWEYTNIDELTEYLWEEWKNDQD